MRKIIGGGFVSLDGVFEAPEKWQMPYYNDEMGKAAGEMYFSSDTFVLGRASYERYKSVFENMGPDHPQAAWMNNTKKFVVSNSLKKADWKNSSIISGDVLGGITRLKQQHGMNIFVAGAKLTSFLIENDLVDELNLLLHPLIVGTGERFFNVNRQVGFELQEHQALGNGVVFLRYAKGRSQMETGGP